MSSDLTDGEQSSDWTLINAAEDDEGHDATAVKQDQQQVVEKAQTILASATQDDSHETMDSFQLEFKVSEIPSLATKKSAETLPMIGSSEASSDANLKDGSDSSDIERISDDGTEMYNMEASVLSQASSFSLVSTPVGGDADMESLASSSSISVIQEDENGDLSNFGCSSKDELPEDLDATRVRSYTHTPNTKLNFALNLLLALSVTMVVGLGIGHFIGWSSRWMNQHHFQQTHIAKLKALQEELVNCLQNPQTYYQEGNGESIACYEKVDYWQEKFDDILSQNHVLQDFIDRSIQEDVAGESDEKCEEANQNIVTEYRKLKFHLITQQLENVATLRRMEALKLQEKETLDRVKQLEEENDELKAQVADEQAKESTDDDDAADRALIQQLSNENKELKEELHHLMVALKLEQEEDDKKSSEELGDLREQINQLKTANSELQQIIAKLRYGQPPSKEILQEEKISSDKKEETEMPKDDSVLHSWLVDNMNDVNLTGFFEYLVKVAMDKDAARRELQQLQENLKSSYKQLSEKAKIGIDTGRTLLTDIQQSFQSKLHQIMQGNASGSLSIESIQKIGKTLKNTVENLYAVGSDMLATDDSASSDSNNESKFRKRVDKLLTNFGKQWESIKTKMWGETDNKKPRNKKDVLNVKEKKVFTTDATENEPANAEQIPSKKKRNENPHKPMKLADTKSNNGNSRSRDKLGSKKKDGPKKKSSNLKMHKRPLAGQKEHNTDPAKTKQKNTSNNKEGQTFITRQHSYQPNKCNKKNKIKSKSGKANSHDKMQSKEFRDKASKNLHKRPKWGKTTKASTKKNCTLSGMPVENSADWVFKRAYQRGNKRRSEQQSDWLFERAHNREKTRKESEKSEWYFERMRRNGDKPEYKYPEKKRKPKSYKKWNDSDEEDSDDEHEEKENLKLRQIRSKKKKGFQNEEDHKQWSTDEESDAEEHEVKSKHRYSWYSYNYDWTFSDPSHTTQFY